MGEERESGGVYGKIEVDELSLPLEADLSEKKNTKIPLIKPELVPLPSTSSEGSVSGGEDTGDTYSGHKFAVTPKNTEKEKPFNISFNVSESANAEGRGSNILELIPKENIAAKPGIIREKSGLNASWRGPIGSHKAPGQLDFIIQEEKLI